ncbi:MAG: InlB B-repeat-containing protein [Clostridia bacterium]|nr:InlB B-repeat-containing protein [Clostridia bacterium]
MKKNISIVLLFFIILFGLRTFSLGTAFTCCDNPDQQYGHDNCTNWVCLNCGAHWPNACQDVPVITKAEVTKYTTGTISVTVAGQNAHSVRAAVWSEEGGQDDIAWYEIKNDTDIGIFEKTVSIDLTPHMANGEQSFYAKIYFSKTSYASTREVFSEHTILWKTDTTPPTSPTLIGGASRYYKFSDLEIETGSNKSYFLVTANPGTDDVDGRAQAYLWVSTDGGSNWNYLDYQQVKMTWNADDNYYEYPVYIDNSETTYTCLVRSIDTMGNWDVSATGEYKVQDVIIDNTIPTIEAPTESQIFYTPEANYTVSVDAEDKGGAGIESVKWRVYDPNGNDVELADSTGVSGDTYSLTYEFKSEGAYTLEPRVIDRANNISYLSSSGISIQVVYDVTAPYGSADTDAYTTNGVFTIDAKAGDGTSGIKEIKYVIAEEDGSNPEEGLIVQNATSGTVNVDLRSRGEGIYKVEVYAYDNAGNSAVTAENKVVYLSDIAATFEWEALGGEEVFFDALFNSDNVVSWGDGTITQCIAGQNKVTHTYSVSDTYTVQIFKKGIVTLNLANKGITSLEVSGATALEKLYCYDNDIKTLDVSKNTALKELLAYGNENIGNINLGNVAIEKLFVHPNQSVSNQNSATKKNYIEVLESKGNKYGRIIYSNNVFKITPNEDGILERILVNGVSIGTDHTDYIFNNSDNEVWLKAEFSHSDTLRSFTANAPVLAEGIMKPVKFVNNVWKETTEDDVEWYNYENGKWANMMLEDGSLFVWIPRYTYKVDYDNNTIDIKWSQGKTDDTSGGYMRHPAFYMGEYLGGNPNANSSFAGRTGNLNELNGFWMAKYMASESSGTIQSKPDKTPLVTDINEAFEKSIALKEKRINQTGVFTHLTKNSEWGAVAYLSMAKGFTSRENTTEKTGNDKSVLQSSTKNIYGVFDLNGPIGEYVAGFIPNAVSQNNAPSLNISYYKEYVDRFSNSKQYYGLSLTELADVTGNNLLPNENKPFFVRGSGDIGVYGYKNATGMEDEFGFRPTIAVDNAYMAGELALFETEASVIAGDYLIITVDFSVKKPWKFDLAEGESLKEKIFDFIDLKFVQTGNSELGSSVELYQTTLNPELLEMSGSETGIIDLENGFNNTFNADEKYFLKIRVGGYADDDKEYPIFINIKNMTSKIIVEEMRLINRENGNALKLEGYPYDKIRLSVVNRKGEYSGLESVGLISTPVKTEYDLGEPIDVTGGVLQLNYNGGLSSGTVDLTASNIVDYDTLTETSGYKEQIPMIYDGKEVLQGDGYKTFNITVSDKRKYKVEIQKSVTPDKGKPFGTVDGAGSYASGDAVTVRAFGMNGYKFKNWTSGDMNITDGEQNELKFNQPESNVNVTANFVGVLRLEEAIPPTKEFEKNDRFTLGPMRLVAVYADGTTEYVTVTTSGLTTNIGIGEILDLDESTDVIIEYGGAEFEYTIDIVKRKYPITLAINNANAGVIRDAENTIKVPYNGRSSIEEYISYDTILSYVAEPKPGYEFAGWDISMDGILSEADKTSSAISFTMPESNITLTANFALLEYTLKYISTEGGVILGETEQVLKKGYDGSVVEAVANDGYYFYGWDDGYTQPVRQDTNVEEDKTYTAIFYEGYEVSFYGYDDIKIGETQRVNAGESAIPPDASQVPVKEGYQFNGTWSEDYTNVQRNLTIYANYDIEGYEVTVTYDSDAGEATGAGIYTLDTLVELSVTKINTNYTFQGWKLLKDDGTDVTTELFPKSNSEPTIYFTMPAYNVRAEAVFVPTVVVGIQVNGVIVYSNFVVGSELNIKAESNEKYDFNKWLEDSGLFTESQSIMREISVQVPSSMTIINADYTATTPMYYKVMIQAEGNGTVTTQIGENTMTGSGMQEALMGSEMEVSITPDEGYQVTELKLNGYAFENPETIPSIFVNYVNMDILIEATFSAI